MDDRRDVSTTAPSSPIQTIASTKVSPTCDHDCASKVVAQQADNSLEPTQSSSAAERTHPADVITMAYPSAVPYASLAKQSSILNEDYLSLLHASSSTSAAAHNLDAVQEEMAQVASWCKTRAPKDNDFWKTNCAGANLEKRAVLTVGPQWVTPSVEVDRITSNSPFTLTSTINGHPKEYQVIVAAASTLSGPVSNSASTTLSPSCGHDSASAVAQQETDSALETTWSRTRAQNTTPMDGTPSDIPEPTALSVLEKVVYSLLSELETIEETQTKSVVSFEWSSMNSVFVSVFDWCGSRVPSNVATADPFWTSYCGGAGVTKRNGPTTNFHPLTTTSATHSQLVTPSMTSTIYSTIQSTLTKTITNITGAKRDETLATRETEALPTTFQTITMSASGSDTDSVIIEKRITTIETGFQPSRLQHDITSVPQDQSISATIAPSTNSTITCSSPARNSGTVHSADCRSQQITTLLRRSIFKNPKTHPLKIGTHSIFAGHLDCVAQPTWCAFFVRPSPTPLHVTHTNTSQLVFLGILSAYPIFYLLLICLPWYLIKKWRSRQVPEYKPETPTYPDVLVPAPMPGALRGGWFGGVGK